MANWQLQTAKAHFSEVVRSAFIKPQKITLRGKPAVVVISIQEYERLTKPKISFVELLRNSPLVGLNLKFKRDKSLDRDIDL